MNEKDSFAEQISNLISQDAGESQPLSDNDEKFAAEYHEALGQLAPEAQHLAFNNVIRYGDSCAYFGLYIYLLNTDKYNRYKVTVRTYWRQGIDSGQYDTTVVSEAGGRRLLGCTRSSTFPPTEYRWEVVGEVRIP